MTVTRRGSSEMWTSMLTSLSSPSASAPSQRSPKRSAYCVLAGIRSREEEVDAALDRADVGRNGTLALELDRVAREAGRDVVRGIGRDSEARHEDDGDHDRHHLQDLRERMRRAQLAVTRDGATAALCGLGRLAHRVLSDVAGVRARLPHPAHPFSKRRVWDSNPRDIAAHWFSRPGPSAARTTLPMDASIHRTASSLSDRAIPLFSQQRLDGL